MKQGLKTFRIFACAAAGAALLLSVLRSVALFTSFDGDIGYFREGAPLVTILYILQALCLLACFALPFLVRRDTLPTERTPLTRAGRIASGAAALACVCLIVLLFIKMGSIAPKLTLAGKGQVDASLIAPFLLSLLGALLLAAATAHLALQALAKAPAPQTLALCGYGLIVAALCLLSVTYFDLFVQMNAPHKVSQHAALLSVMAATLFDVRTFLGIARPRAHGVAAAIAILLCIPTGVSNIVAFVGGVYQDPLLFGIDLFLLTFGVYTAVRMTELALNKSE